MQKSEWTAEQNLAEAQSFKDKGNQQFSSKNYRAALRFYHKAILHLAGIIDRTSSVAAYSRNVASEQISQKSNELKYSVYLNMSQIYIYQSKYEKGIQTLGKAAAIKATAKLFYRRGICYLKTADFERARVDFAKVADLDLSMKQEVQKMMGELRNAQKKEDKKASSLFQKFFK